MRHRRASAPPPAAEAPEPKKGERLSGVVVSWESSSDNPFAAHQASAVGVVRLDLDGREVQARWSGAAALKRDVRPSRAGQRVTIWRDTKSLWRCHLVEAEHVEPPAPSATPRSKAPPRPVPSLLVPAIKAALAAGESASRVADRWNLSVEQVFAARAR